VGGGGLSGIYEACRKGYVSAMRCIEGCGVVGWIVVVAACGGGEKEPDFPPSPPADTTEEAADPSWATETPASEESTEAEPEAAPEELAKPEFTPGMTINQAINAVPTHYDYVGLDPEVLAKPLMNIETYKECKVTEADKFKVKLAIWDGKVVGADVTASTPAKKECIERVVRALEYEEQVESVNTVEYSF
jgi:hypothetical protein